MSEQQEIQEMQENQETPAADEAQAQDAQQTGVQPEGNALYEVDIQMNTAALYDYFLRHVYTSLSGILGTVIGVFCLMAYFIKGASVLYLVFGIVIILYLPWNLYLTARRQALQETFRKPLHYAFYENGIEVSQGEVRQMQKWEDMVKAVSTSKSIIVYTGKNAASIFPRKDLGENVMGLIQIISTHMEPKKVKIKE
jgi:hypothetical protein